MGHGFLPAFGELLAPFQHLLRWQQRISAIGHGERTDIDAERALAVARESAPLPGNGVDPADPLRLHAGQRVTVTPDDYGKVPVTGELVTLDLHEVALRRGTDAGEVAVHFQAWLRGRRCMIGRWFRTMRGRPASRKQERCTS